MRAAVKSYVRIDSRKPVHLFAAAVLRCSDQATAIPSATALPKTREPQGKLSRAPAWL